MVRTFLGLGLPDGYATADGVASDATFHAPADLTADRRSGQLLVVDRGSGRLRLVTGLPQYVVWLAPGVRNVVMFDRCCRCHRLTLRCRVDGVVVGVCRGERVDEA